MLLPHALTAEQDDEWLQISCEEKHYRSLPPPLLARFGTCEQTDFSSLK